MRGTPIRPTIGSLMPDELMPKLRLRRLNSKPSTLLAALLARRAGLAVAHLEAGLRSRSLTQLFPEEVIRLLVMRLSDVLFAGVFVALATLVLYRWMIEGRLADDWRLVARKRRKGPVPRTGP